MPSLDRISVSPVKGTAQQHPTSAMLTAEGIAGNRRFHLRTERGELISGYDDGTLVRIVSEVDPATGELRCRFPDGSVIAGPGDALGEAFRTVFDDRVVDGHEVLGPFAAAFSAFVGQPVRLVRTDRDGDGPDVHRLSLVSFASVAELGRRGGYDGELDARRFRMNLELGGAEPFEEDTWAEREVAIGEAVIRVLGQIPRCRVTNQDPATGEHEWSTLTKIAAFRPLITGPDRGIPFGMYAEVVAPGMVHLGDGAAPVTPSAVSPVRGM
jgi:uncharacterized protein YcbX